MMNTKKAVATLLPLLLSTSQSAALSSVDVPFFARPTSSISPGAAAVVSETQVMNSLDDFDYQVNDRLPYFEEGYKSYTWRENQINYIELGDSSKPPLLLIHGFGASAYHWRYNLPVLARDFHVFAICMLGFGQSDKPIEDYSSEIWRDQAADFIRYKIGRPTVVAGNSLGGFTALFTAATDEMKDLVAGCISLNGAGRFRDPNEDGVPTNEPNPFIESLQTKLQRFVIGASFVYTKQPMRIRQVLRQVYTNFPENVDDDLVKSIHTPSLDENAPEVFYRVITKAGGKAMYVDDLLAKVECPLLLCWGINDPWIQPSMADKMELVIKSNNPRGAELVSRVNVVAGHCPQDENAEAVNAAIRNFALGRCFAKEAALASAQVA